jgi:hypothetical protein
MLDPIAVHLFFMLQRTTSVAAVDLCWFDEQYAERILAQARMYQHAPGLWACTGDTAAWAQQMRTEITTAMGPPLLRAKFLRLG